MGDLAVRDDPTHPQTMQTVSPGPLVWRVALTSLAVTVVALGAFTALGGIGDQDGDERAIAGTAHAGLVAGTIWVANEDDASLTAIDARTNRVMTTVEGIDGPHNVQVSPDGRGVWAVSGHDAMAVMLDAETLRVHGSVPTGKAPAHVVVTPDGRMTYTTNGAAGTVSAIDSSTMRARATIRVGPGPHGLRPSPDGRWVYVANLEGTTLSVIATDDNTKVADIEVGRAPAQVAFSPDGRFVYASLNAENSVAKVDVASRRLVGKLRVGSGPIQTYVSPDNRLLLVANQGNEDRPGTTVTVVDTATFTVAATVETGRGAHGVVIEPSGRHAYVTNLYGNDVAVLDLKELRVVARVPVGRKPNGVSFSAVTVQEQPATKVELPDVHGETGAHGGDGH